MKRDKTAGPRDEVPMAQQVGRVTRLHMDNALTLPGTLPGLLRRGSPVVDADGRLGVVVSVVGAVAHCAVSLEVRAYALEELSLDLTDATGRAHAAWWAERGELERKAPVLFHASTAARVLAQTGRNLYEADVAKLRALCLVLVGAS